MPPVLGREGMMHDIWKPEQGEPTSQDVASGKQEKGGHEITTGPPGCPLIPLAFIALALLAIWGIKNV